MTARRQAVFVSIALPLLVLAVFGRSVSFDFVNYDDQNYVYANPAITGGLSWSSFVWAFTHIHAQNWHPLTTLSHMLDCEIYGVNAAGHHLTNVVLHAGAAVLLFTGLRRLTGAMWRSAFVAALFAIHPLRIESVVWIAERKDVLSGIFFMLTLIAYRAYCVRKNWQRYLLMSGAFVLGLLCKPMLVTVPFVLLLLDYWPLERLRRTTWVQVAIEKIPLLCLSGLSCFTTLAAQQQYIGSGEDLPLQLRLSNAALSYLTYVEQTFWPTRLMPFYPHPESRVSTLQILLAVGFLLVITTAALLCRKSRPYLLVGWLWYVGMLVPVIGIVQVGWQGHADRYTYLPQIGFYLALTWLLADALRRWQISRVLVIASMSATILTLSSVSFIDAAYWRDSETLWKRTLELNPNNDVALNNLGTVALGRGAVDEAQRYFEKVLEVRPDNPMAQANIGNVLVTRGEVERGVAHLRRALELEPDNADTADLLGTALLRSGNVSDAVAAWQESLRASPDDGNAMSNLAWVYATNPEQTMRDRTKAVELAERAAALAHDRNALVLRVLAAAYANAGRFDEAKTAAERALQIARTENNTGLVAELEATLTLYATHTPLRDPSLASHGDQTAR